MPALALRGVVKRFDDLVAVGGVDLDLEPGVIVAWTIPSSSSSALTTGA